MMRSRRSRAAVAVVTAMVLSAGPSPAQTREAAPGGLDDGRYQRTANLDLIASAHPIRAGERRDLAVGHRYVRGPRKAKIDTSATSSAVCDDCSGRAVAVHTVFLSDPRTTTARNVSTAWSSCSDCGATTLSVQIVTVKRTRAVRVVNRAFASNVACTSCRTAAAAYQLVVLSDTGRPMTKQQRRDLVAWTTQKATLLQTAAATEGSARGRQRELTQELSVDDLARVVTGNEPERVLDKDLEVSVR